MNWLLVIVGGMVGAPLRYVADTAVKARLGTGFPWGTFAVNVTGCALLGALAGASTAVHLLLGTGLCGALTTYSTFSYETLRLPPVPALLNALGSATAGVGAAYLGYALSAS